MLTLMSNRKLLMEFHFISRQLQLANKRLLKPPGTGRHSSMLVRSRFPLAAARVLD